MFGVDTSGNDTLSPQFRRGKQGPTSGAKAERKEGLRFMIESNIRWFRQCGLDAIRRKVLETMQAAGDLLPPEADIEGLVEQALYDKAERLALEGQNEQHRMASQAAILSINA
ncbi:hypothetical protein HYW83_02045 [Candidatus Peregrinibacteria bacterium]|nr:hypothetical protein [Candidatus Peregrinibacteria bacterium]